MEPTGGAVELINYKGVASVPRWVSFRRFVRAALSVVLLAAVVAAGSTTGVLGAAYEWFWMNTLGQTYTSWFEENPWRYVLLVGVGLLPVSVLFPPQAWARLILVSGAFGLGWVGGHIFFPQ
jgi:hypothetical protein